MTSIYYRNLGTAFLIVTLIPIIYFSWLSKSHSRANTDDVVGTTYHYVQVNSPIQPIPSIASIDRNWYLLGKALFNSTLLSSDNTIACSSCHLVDYGGDDGFAVSTGVKGLQGDRNSPTVLNSTFNIRQFWDGRSASLAEQVAGPIHADNEMASTWNEVIHKLSNDNYFSKTFNNISKQGITAETITLALTIYEQSLITPNAPIDLFLLGNESALSAQQKRGFEKFQSFGCITCHQGVNIGGNIMQKLGRIGEVPDQLLQDKGKFNYTNKETDKHIFKVPSLRNVAQTSPYFHNGSIEKLPDAVKIMAKAQLGVELSELDTQDIVALLQSFSSRPVEVLTDAN